MNTETPSRSVEETLNALDAACRELREATERLQAEIDRAHQPVLEPVG